ncbi:CPBP family intramembrane glutamic endopeptidase [Lyngbya confervoides]|uniref:CPBP family intramembrane metalloprotease n=1 Tax=Lyngbya confervoides BDU141951 TaxID=1574623 RepID=A0ABD4T6K7_9CYAN|nr:CPBP family intramembrane glutamic endopeptidase [Lyngbya confervoides]MCM1983875.1 CPBP family intramembrane metalloprotease [Lyngbya confervoides BDU141951]
MTSLHHNPSPPLTRSLLGKFFRFLRQPRYAPETGLMPRQILGNVMRLYSLAIALLIPIVIVIQILSSTVIKLDDNKFRDILQNMPLLGFVFLAVVFAPIFEESIFRLPLRYSPLNLSIALILVLSLAGPLFLGQAAPWILLSVLLGIILLSFCLGARLAQRTRTDHVHRWYARHLKGLIYGSAILFGLIHITNYHRGAWAFAPVLVLPQVTLGFFLAYIRLKYGFWWAVFTHALHNFIVTTPLLVLLLGSDQLQQQVLYQSKDVTLAPLDYGLLLVVLGAMVLGLTVTVLSVLKLFKDWQAEKRVLG